MVSLRNRPARVEHGDGYYYNSFPKVQLGNGLEVVVPSLVFGQADARKPKEDLFELMTEKQRAIGRKIRILATCIEPECGSEQLHLVDDGERLATQFFTPREGLDISGYGYLPSVIPHKFGLILMGVGDVPDLFDEVRRREDVGIITLSDNI